MKEVNRLNEELEKRVEERTASLAKSEERYRSTLDNMVEGCQILGYDWRYLYINNTAENQNKRPKEELIGKIYMEMWPGIEKTEAFHVIKKGIEERTSQYLENEFFFPDGSKGWFELKIEPVPDGVFIMSTDITYRKQADKVLSDSELRYRRLFESARDGILILDAETGMIVDVNHFLIEMLGFSREQFISKSIWELGSFKDIIANKASFAELQENKYICYEDKPLETIDGRRIEVEFVSYVYQTGNHQVIQCNIRDISERKRIENILRDRDELLRETGRIAKIGGWEFNAITMEGTWTDEVARIHDLDPKEKTNVSQGINFYTPESRTTIEAAIKIAIELKKPYDLDLEMITAKNNHKWVRTIGSPIMQEGKVVKIRGSFQDITERKKAEEALKTSKERLVFATEGANLGIWNLDTVTGELIFSNLCKELFGIGLDETMSYHRFSDALHPDDRERTDKAIKDTLDNHKDYDIEYRCLWPDESIHWLEAKGRGYYNATGKAVRLEGVVQDITERKQAEKILQESEERFRGLYENSTVGIYRTTPDGKIILANPTLVKLLGYPSFEELSERNLEKDGFEPSYERTHFMDVLKREGEVKGLESAWTRMDGTTLFIRESARAINDKEGKIIYYDGIVEDITLQKKAEQELIIANKDLTFQNEEKEKRANELIIANKELVFQNDEKEKRAEELIIANKELAYLNKEKVKRADELIIANNVLDFQNKEREKQAKELILVNKELAFQNEEKEKRASELVIANKELAFQNKEKEKRVVELILANKEKEKRADELIIANEAILQSEKNFRRSISKSPMGIRIVSSDGKTIYANKAFLAIFELNSLEEFTSIPAKNLYTPESYKQHQKRKEKRNNGYDVSDYEISIVCANAGIRHIKIWRREVLWNGTKHYQVINLDITEQKKLTIDLIAAKEQAEESDRLKSAFLTNMSHEIRTPMNGILGFTELLKTPNLSSDDQQDFIQTIQISGARMLNTINSIVDISKIESGLMKVDIKETNINEKIEFTYKFFKPDVEIKGLQFLFKNSLPAKEAIIKTDNEKVYGILTNLVKNAIKFTYEGSIEFGYEKKGEYLEFFVKDTGIGIPQKQYQLIFERFRQGSESHNRGYEGSGLGLSIAKTYVEMLGGKIWVESEEGKGSTFYFTIPYNVVSEKQTELKDTIFQEHKEVQVKSLKILIVEDDEISYSLLTRMFQNISKEVLHAITGVQAVEACRNNPDLDLVLMDIRMPKMDGNEATRQIRQFNTDVIIIAQTAYAFSGDKEKATEAGCNDYISKPIDMTLLYELIKKHCNKN
jgi:PAS domain S-box-containing protein